MRQSIKAALLSGLIFPGVGQIKLGYKKRGGLYIVVMGVFLYLMFREIMQQAYAIIAKMQKSGQPLDIESISNTTSNMASFSDNVYMNSLLLCLIVIWIIAIIDAYLLGNKTNM